jgi:CheY-like chemotaxis protein
MLPAAFVSPALRVLVVDDDEINLDIARELLEQIGVGEVHVAMDGAQGLKLLRQLGTVDFVVTDIYMPDMDGIEFMAELAKCAFAGRVILVSGVSLETMALARQIAEVSGIQVVAAMEKPLQRQYLAQAMGFETA